MTKKEAMKYFGIRESEGNRIRTDAVRELINNTEEYLGRRWIPSSDREQAERDLEALRALL